MITRIVVHDDGRTAENINNALLIITDDATYCRAKYNPSTGFVTVYGGSVWPGELPEVFEKRGVVTNQQPSNTYVRPEVIEHFRDSVSRMSFERK